MGHTPAKLKLKQSVCPSGSVEFVQLGLAAGIITLGVGF